MLGIASGTLGLAWNDWAVPLVATLVGAIVGGAITYARETRHDKSERRRNVYLDAYVILERFKVDDIGEHGSAAGHAAFGRDLVDVYVRMRVDGSAAAVNDFEAAIKHGAEWEQVAERLRSANAAQCDRDPRDDTQDGGRTESRSARAEVGDVADEASHAQLSFFVATRRFQEGILNELGAPGLYELMR